MISALENLGSQLNFDILKNKINSIKLKKTDSYICEINFNTNQRKIDIIPKPVSNENMEKLANEYLWVGNLKGSIPQWHITSDNLSYVLNSISVLLEKLDNNSNLKSNLTNIFKQYYANVGKVQYFNISNIKIHIIDKDYTINFTPGGINSRKYLNKIIIDELLKQTNNLNDYYRSICLYTISIDNKLLAKDEEYIKILKDSMSPSEDNYITGVCSVCGRNSIL